MRPTNIVYCFVIAFSLLLAGCATTTKNNSEHNQSTQRMTASALYAAGKEAMNLGDQQAAIRHFNTLVALYPVDKFALQGRLELAYAYHKDGQTNSAIATTERFIDNHPQHKNLDYAYYLRGLTAYEAAIVKLDSGSIVTTTSTPYEAQMAFAFLTELSNLFPEGKYNADASQRIKELNERVAQHLIFAAKQQLDQSDPAKAALLAKIVIDEYPASVSIQEAAIITNQAYQLLGLNEEKEKQPPAIARMKATLAAELPSPAISTVANPTIPASVNLMTPSSEIRDTAWLKSQGPDLYTIQVLGTENEVLLRHQIKSGDLQSKVAYYKKSRAGIAWYSLVYGSYATRAEAKSAAKSLPSSLRAGQPWIRKIGDIQASLGGVLN